MRLMPGGRERGREGGRGGGSQPGGDVALAMKRLPRVERRWDRACEGEIGTDGAFPPGSRQSSAEEEGPRGAPDGPRAGGEEGRGWDTQREESRRSARLALCGLSHVAAAVSGIHVPRFPRRRGYDPFLPLLLFFPSLLLLLLVFRRTQRRGGRAMARVERDAAAAIQALVLVGVAHGFVVPW